MNKIKQLYPTVILFLIYNLMTTRYIFAEASTTSTIRGLTTQDMNSSLIDLVKTDKEAKSYAKLPRSEESRSPNVTSTATNISVALLPSQNHLVSNPLEYLNSISTQDIVVDDSSHKSQQNINGTDTSHFQVEFNVPNCTITFYIDPVDVMVKCENVAIPDVAPLIPEITTILVFRKCRQAQTLSLPILSHLSQLRNLVIEWSQVRFVVSKFLTGLVNLKILNLSLNVITVVHPKLFVNTPNIEKLILKSNAIITLARVSESVRHLMYLKTLILDENKILEKILKNHLQPLQNSLVEKVTLSDCAISLVERGAFKPLKNLKILILSVNPIGRAALFNITSDLPDTQIDHLELRGMTSVFTGGMFITRELAPLVNTNISSLDLDSNYITRLLLHSFPNITSLKKLTLRNCFLEWIEDGTFESLPNLEELLVGNNRLTRVPSHLPNLKLIDMSSNPREGIFRTEFELPDSGLSGLKNLREFILDQSFYPGPITRNTFARLVNLERLAISLTVLRNISDFAFQDLVNLKRLYLPSNLISSISSNMFAGLEKLTQLYLYSNQISYISDRDTFKPLKSLEVLYFQNNKLKMLQPNMFLNNYNLEIVNLANNLLNSWNYEIFPQNGSMRVLLLENNVIKNVTRVMLNEFRNLEIIDLSRNNFQCSSCCMKRFQYWLLDPGNTTVKGATSYICTYSTSNNVSFLNVPLSEELCWPEVSNLALVLTIALSVSAILMLFISISAYRLRWYIRYIVFSLRSRVRKYRALYDPKYYEYDAFVSYSSTDIAWVAEQLVPHLEEGEDRCRLCLHDRDFTAGVPITDNILEAVDKSRKTIMVLTEDFVKSTWCMFELHMAQHRLFEKTRDALVLVLFRDVNKDKMPKQLKYLMKTRTYIEWVERDSSAVGNRLFWERLKEAIRSPEEIQVLSRVT